VGELITDAPNQMKIACEVCWDDGNAKTKIDLSAEIGEGSIRTLEQWVFARCYRY
jgi:hypothetical protein